MIDRKKINRDYIEMLLVIIPFLLALWNSFTIDSIQTPSNVDKVKCAALHLTVWLMVYSVFSQYMECVVPSKYDSVLILSAFVLLGSSLFQIYVYAQSDQDEPMQNNEYLQTSRKVFYLGTICFCFIYFLFGHVWSSAGQCIRFAGGTYATRRILSRPRTTGSKILGAVGAINSTINSDPAASGNISITSAAKRLQVAASMAAQAESQIASGISPSKNLERLEQAVEGSRSSSRGCSGDC